VDRLQADNRLLGAKLKEALSVQPAAVDPRELAKAEDRIRALQKENELFKMQLSQRAASSPSPATQELTAKLNEQIEVAGTLRAENEILKKQSADWQQRYAALAAAPASRPEPEPAPAVRESAPGEMAANNRALQKQVELWKHLAQTAQRSQATPAEMPSEAQRELRVLRARVEALEAKPVPYSAEEMALFQRSPPSLAANVATTVAPPAPGAGVPPAEGPLTGVSRGIPPGAGALVLAAERALRRANFVEAEQKYLEVLRQDENNVTMLGNLAAAQLEQGRVSEAEKNVIRALQMDPNDHFTLYLLGRIRFDQGKLDEALDALSRSVQAQSDYAASQNYLGIVLSEKGLRAPAEAALRRAVQLQPDYAAAHNNLAIVYATQQPPALALARWHYRKALAAGHQKNPDLEKLFGQVQ
jgi:tetratricopeptide (TPR) repeat protein